jgi:hypothetical protein
VIKKISTLGTLSAALLTASWALESTGLQVLHLPLSTKGHTRLAVKDDKIVDVFAMPVSLKGHVELLKSGHVLLIGEGIKERAYVTVITAKGHAQDLILTPTSKDPSPLILEVVASQKPELLPDQHLADIVKAFAQRRPPLPFLKDEVLGSVRLKPVKGLTATLQETWSTPREIVGVFEIIAEGSQAITLVEKDLAPQGCQAVWIEKTTLQPGERTRLLTVNRKERTFQ